MSVPPKHSQAESLTPKLETFELFDRVSVPDSCITGMAVTENNKLLLCNRLPTSKNKGILVIEQNKTLVKTVQMTEPDPWDITIIPDNSHTAVVSFGSSKIQFLDTKSLQPDKVVTLNSSGSGIASTKGCIFVGSEKEIFVLNVDGTLQRTISLPGIEKIEYIHVDSQDRIHFCENFFKIRCITTDGKQLYSFKLDRETYHRGIATDHNGYVYFVGRYTNQIVRLTPDGSMDRVVLNKVNRINFPLTLCFNETCDQMYVSNSRSKEIFIVKANNMRIRVKKCMQKI